MFNRKPNIEQKLSLKQVEEICAVGSNTVEANLIWANARIKGLEATIESLHLKHEIAHYASMFIAATLSQPSYNNCDDMQTLEYENEANARFVKTHINLAKMFIEEMENEKIS